MEKKRGTGIPSLKGAVCSTSKNREYLEDIAKELNLDTSGDDTRVGICDKLHEKMLLLEKYSSGKEKMTYVMIPSNHPSYPFPYNLEDRIEFTKAKITNNIKFKLNMSVKKENKKSGPEKGYPTYHIIIVDEPKLKEFEKVFTDLNAKYERKSWVITLE